MWRPKWLKGVRESRRGGKGRRLRERTSAYVERGDEGLS
jgi:hypothetical protein